MAHGSSPDQVGQQPHPHQQGAGDQLPLISVFMTGFTDSEDQRCASTWALRRGLDMDNVLVASVTKARHGDKQQMLGWGTTWTPRPGTSPHRLTMVRKLLLESDTELARAGARMVPTGQVEKVGRECRGPSRPT